MLRRRVLLFAVVLTLAAVGIGCASISIDYSTPRALLEPYKTAVAEIVGLLDQGRGDDATVLLDELQGAVVEARSMLTGTRFAGETSVLTDPFTLPAGAYRAHLKTDGSPFVTVIPVAAPDGGKLLFTLYGSEAASGMTTLYVSNGARIMLQFTFVNAPYELWFEKIE
jgi:hypothetical protein